MPRAQIGDLPRWLQDLDTQEVSEAPPTLNQWYPVFDDEDVRHLWCVVIQTNDEAAAKQLQIRWTIDGNVYFLQWNANNNTYYYIYRNFAPSAAGTAGLSSSTSRLNAGDQVDKRGLAYKVEVRQTGAIGTNQTLLCDCVIETLELT